MAALVRSARSVQTVDRPVLAVVLAGACSVASACGFEHGVGPADSALADVIGSTVGDASGGDATTAALCDPADPRLRACYTFEGNTLDGSSYGNHIVAATTSFSSGHSGLGLTTTTGTYAVASTASLDVSMLTIRLWIKPNTLPDTAVRMGLVDSASRWRLFLAPGGALRCAVTGGIDYTTPPGKVAAGTWQRVACAFDGSLMEIHVDGVLAGTKTQASTMPTPGTGMVVGHNNPTGENFDGTIDELQVYGAIVAP